MELVCVNLPTVPPATLHAGGSLTLGRSSSCDVVIPDPRVSGRHAMLVESDGRVIITDLGSRHGVYVGGVRLSSKDSAEVRKGDLIVLGDCAFRFVDTAGATIIRPQHDGAERMVSTAPADEPVTILPEQLMKAIDSLAGAADETDLSDRLARATVDLANFPRAVVLEPRHVDGEELALRAGASRPGSRGDIRPSRSLVRAALAAGWAELQITPGTAEAPASIVSMDIHEACCAALRVEGVGVALLYADARGDESTVGRSGRQMLRALSSLGGLSWANLQRAEIESRRKLLEQELDGARRVQERFLPAARGKVGACEYALAYMPGRVVAGDMVDIFDIPGSDRVGLLLGDVVDKGPAAALLMATLQTQARHALRAGRPLQEVFAELCADVAQRFAPATASLWAALWNPRTRELTCCDAGHGYAATIAPDAGPQRLKVRGGLWIGVEHEMAYEISTLTVQAGARLVVFSDGVAEQRGVETGKQFGFDGVLAALRGSTDAGEDVQRLMQGLRDHAGGERYADDVSVLAVALG
jgi:hypothetical protein